MLSTASESQTETAANHKTKPTPGSSVCALNPLDHPDRFVDRHVGPSTADVDSMVKVCGHKSLDTLIDDLVPRNIRLTQSLKLPSPVSEHEALTCLRGIAARNRIHRSYIGMGYYDTIVPAVIQRNVLENPGWYTQYTPYQAEIAQGRLESLLNFQTMVAELSGLEIANASLLDEATAAAEAMHLAFAAKGNPTRRIFLVSDTCHPQTIDVVRTRAKPHEIEVIVGDFQKFTFDDHVFGALVQYPATDGAIHDFRATAEAAHNHNALFIVATDLLALTLLTPPGEFGADIAIGNSQRFGVPLGFGGPHAAFFATRDAYKRLMPGRLVGVSRDSRGRPGYRLSLQTREQHIRRDRATSNICTAQALLANMAALYAVYHGPDGLRKIAERVVRLTRLLACGLEHLKYHVATSNVFDTLRISHDEARIANVLKAADVHRVNLRIIDDRTLCVSLDEAATLSEVSELLQIFNEDEDLDDFSVADETKALSASASVALFDAPFLRKSSYLTHTVFNLHHSETEMLRYLRRLESRDLSLTHSMIPLGSCTMKLNATCEMFPVSWPEFSRLHPFAPATQTQGYQTLFHQLEDWLAEITGFAAISLQPNSGAQGEYAGLLAIRAYHEKMGNGARNICLIPQSAHGTNPASAIMAGFKVVAVKCDSDGNIDIADLRSHAQAHANDLGVLMVTYPSTHGVFEETIRTVCDIVHEFGGLVYMDGANMNAQVGLCRPADIGADVCHLNLHKTFCIPHGGGGPGMGPIGVTQTLAPFLPGHSIVSLEGRSGIGAVSEAPWGSASILPISWVYIAAMGAAGLTHATRVAILNANYIASRLSPYYPILFKGTKGLVAHECILDLRQFKSATVEDVAKRLMDYGFHAPTISWPVPGTMMVEPTESEPKEELDRFCDALILIHAEILAVENGHASRTDNLLKNAPHTADMIAASHWNHPYTREQAAYPAPWLHDHKFWPFVGRIDNVYGDRNLVCSCAGMEEFTGNGA